MIRRIVFFQPRTFAARNYRNSAGEEQTWTPWFALSLSVFAQAAGLEVALIDARTDEDWSTACSGLGPGDVLAASVMTGRAITDAMAATSAARAGGARVVWGGPHVTLFPDETLREARVDAVVPGFGASAFAELCAALSTGGWPHPGPAVLSPTDHVLLRRTLSRSRTQDTVVRRSSAATNSLALDLIKDWSLYANPDVAVADRTVNLITSEGCTRTCTYCSEPGKALTYAVPESVMLADEIKVRSGATGFKLHDPNFFDDIARASEFASRFSSIVGLPWAATMHPADLTAIPEVDLNRFAESGLCRLLVGLESPDPVLARLAGKQYDTDRIPDLVDKLKRAGVRGMFTFIVGWPGADDGHYQRTVDCARRIKDVWSEHQAKIHYLEPWPGTPIFTFAQRHGFVAPTTLAQWAEIDYYQAQHSSIHDDRWKATLRDVNKELSPYVDA